MIRTKNLVRAFKSGQTDITILKGINFSAQSGEFVAIMGRSGAGKSTLMYQMSLLDTPTSGEVIIDGNAASLLSTKEQEQFRLEKLGYVFQDYALMPELTALENVALPLLMQGLSRLEAGELARQALERVGLSTHLHQVPSQLSGGEQQRVSISRAIAHKPDILFADEPTANLDRESSGVIMDIFRELHKEGQTIIMVTHEEEYGRMAERIVRLDDGRIVGELKQS